MYSDRQSVCVLYVAESAAVCLAVWATHGRRVPALSKRQDVQTVERCSRRWTQSLHC